MNYQELWKMGTISLLVLIVFVVGLYACVPNTRNTIEGSINQCLDDIVLRGVTQEVFVDCVTNTSVEVTKQLLEELRVYLADYDLGAIGELIRVLLPAQEEAVITLSVETKEEQINRVLEFIESIE